MFSNVWLHFKNYIRKQFSVFGNILKMLFSYKFFTLSQPFSQLPNKFYIKKSITTHRKSTTIHIKPTTTQHRNHQNATTHTTTTTTKKSQIKEIKQISERVIGEKVDRRESDRRSSRSATIRPSSKGRGRSRKREIAARTTNSATRTRRRNLAAASRVGARSCHCIWGWAAAHSPYSLFFLSLSAVLRVYESFLSLFLSLHVCEFRK